MSSNNGNSNGNGKDDFKAFLPPSENYDDVIAAALGDDFENYLDPVAVPVFVSVGEGPVCIGSFQPHRDGVTKLQGYERDQIAQSLKNVDGSITAAQAQDAAEIWADAQTEDFLCQLSPFFTEMASILWIDANLNAQQRYQKLCGWAPSDDAEHIKRLTAQFVGALKYLRGTPEQKKRRSLNTIWNTWHEIVTAIQGWPSDTPPKVGEFALSLPRFKPKTEPKTRTEKEEAKEKAYDAFKHELRKLRGEGLAPETDFRKLFRYLRSNDYCPLPYEQWLQKQMEAQVDVNAGDQLH